MLSPFHIYFIIAHLIIALQFKQFKGENNPLPIFALKSLAQFLTLITVHKTAAHEHAFSS